MTDTQLIDEKLEQEAIIEDVARAIFSERNGKWDYSKWRSDPRIAEAYRKDAAAAIKSYKEFL